MGRRNLGRNRGNVFLFSYLKKLIVANFILSFRNSAEQYMDDSPEEEEEEEEEKGSSKYFKRKTTKPTPVNEITVYLNSALSIIKTDEALLQHWHNHTEEFPGLSRMARDFFSPGVSSASIERRFSVAGHILNKRRSKLSSSNLEKLILLNDWQKNTQ